MNSEINLQPAEHQFLGLPISDDTPASEVRLLIVHRKPKILAEVKISHARSTSWPYVPRNKPLQIEIRTRDPFSSNF